jgi:hypothetical protein
VRKRVSLETEDALNSSAFGSLMVESHSNAAKILDVLLNVRHLRAQPNVLCIAWTGCEAVRTEENYPVTAPVLCQPEGAL